MKTLTINSATKLSDAKRLEQSNYNLDYSTVDPSQVMTPHYYPYNKYTIVATRYTMVWINTAIIIRAYKGTKRIITIVVPIGQYRNNVDYAIFAAIAWIDTHTTWIK